VRKGWLSVERRIDGLVERLRQRCPGLPDVRNADDPSLAFPPSFVILVALMGGVPVYLVAKGASLSTVVGVTSGITIGWRLFDGFALKRVDALHRRRWERWAAEPWPAAARVLRITRAIVEASMRGAAAALAFAVVLAICVLIVRVVGVSPLAPPVMGGIAVLAALLAFFLGFVTLAGTVFEMLIPTLMGPASPASHVVSRHEIAALKPLLETEPVRTARTVWDLLRALRL
jgi:hypothetical protein